jgi:hypothetical protein
MLLVCVCRYNVFTSHGPDLYGTEPASYYLLNGLLNFNVAFPAALLVIPAQLLLATLLKKEAPPDTRNPHLLSQVGRYERAKRSCTGNLLINYL